MFLQTYSIRFDTIEEFNVDSSEHQQHQQRRYRIQGMHITSAILSVNQTNFKTVKVSWQPIQISEDRYDVAEILIFRQD